VTIAFGGSPYLFEIRYSRVLIAERVRERASRVHFLKRDFLIMPEDSLSGQKDRLRFKPDI